MVAREVAVKALDRPLSSILLPLLAASTTKMLSTKRWTVRVSGDRPQHSKTLLLMLLLLLCFWCSSRMWSIDERLFWVQLFDCLWLTD